jgi:hypothetical protein
MAGRVGLNYPVQAGRQLLQRAGDAQAPSVSIMASVDERKMKTALWNAFTLRD